MVYEKQCPFGKRWDKDFQGCVDHRDLVLVFKTDDLFESFGLEQPTLDPIDFQPNEMPISEVDRMVKDLGIQCEDDWDVHQALMDEQYDSWSKAYEKEMVEAFELLINQIEGWKYEYYSEQDEQQYRGELVGVKAIEVDTADKTVVVVPPEFLHTINAMIAGDGMFDVTARLPERIISEDASLKDWMQSHFNWVRKFYEIYPPSKPTPDMEHLYYKVGFNERYFIELLREKGCKVGEE